MPPKKSRKSLNNAVFIGSTGLNYHAPEFVWPPQDAPFPTFIPSTTTVSPASERIRMACLPMRPVSVPSAPSAPSSEVASRRSSSPLERRTPSPGSSRNSVDDASEFSFVDQDLSPRSWSPPPVLDGSHMEPTTRATAKLDAYSNTRRELLDILTSLHSTGIQQDLDLPQICVIGSQSVGKSSLIESMSGIKLPRDSGTCTRCPTECRLQHAQSWSCRIVLRFHMDASGRPLSSPRDVPFGPILLEQDKGRVEHMLRRAQLAILHPTMDTNAFLSDSEPITAGHTAQTFSQNCVCIRVAGPDVPDLYFYDLPGIIANVSDGGNEDDIRLVESLAKSFIDRTNCIVLLVISCESVLTKVDRIEPGGEAKWINILRNKENVLPNGWFCVKQPDLPQLRSGISWEDAKAAEKRFFEETSPWSLLDRGTRGRLGSLGLAEQLGEILSELVAQKLPVIAGEITRQLRFVNDELVDMPAPNLIDPKTEVVGLFREFERKLSIHMQGLPDVYDADNITSGIVYNVNTAFEHFKDNVRQTAPRFHPWSSRTIMTKQIQKELTDAADEDDVVPAPTTSKGWYLDQVMDLAKRCRTRELPGSYPFAVTQKLIARSLDDWESLAARCIEEIRILVSNHVMKLVRLHFRKHILGGLHGAVTVVVAEHLRQRFQGTLNKIKNLCANELTPYTLNDHYFFSNRSQFLGQYKNVYRQSRGHKALLTSLQTHNSPANAAHDQRWQEINDVMGGLARLGIPGLKPTDLAKLLPEDEMTPGLEIMAEVRAYFKVAYKRFVDNIPQQIDTDFIQGLDGDLGSALASLELTHEQCAAWLQEDPDEVLRREDLLGKKKRLELAKEKIESVAQSSKTF
ncbi:hypothetical protein FRB96_007847 [Tulasnella sp. 330]|nr:hypothetical protein FRB96_007847 [Tulasnella sp. 330]